MADVTKVRATTDGHVDMSVPVARATPEGTVDGQDPTVEPAPETPAPEDPTPAPEDAPQGDETPSDEETPKPEEKEPASAKFEALSRQERQNQQDRAAIKAERKALEAEKAEIENAKKLKQLAKDDPKAFLQMVEESTGLSNAYQHITEALLDSDKFADKQANEAENDRLAKIEAFIDEQRKEKQTAEEQAAVRNFTSEIDAHMKTVAEETPLLNAIGSAQMVYDNIVSEHFAKTDGDILPIEQAVQLGEERLREELGSTLDKLFEAGPVRELALQKLTALGVDVPRGTPPPPEESEPQRQNVTPKPATLSNRQQTTVPLRGSAYRGVTEDESKRLAAQLLRWD